MLQPSQKSRKTRGSLQKMPFLQIIFSYSKPSPKERQREGPSIQKSAVQRHPRKPGIKLSRAGVSVRRLGRGQARDDRGWGGYSSVQLLETDVLALCTGSLMGHAWNRGVQAPRCQDFLSYKQKAQNTPRRMTGIQKRFCYSCYQQSLHGFHGPSSSCHLQGPGGYQLYSVCHFGRFLMEFLCLKVPTMILGLANSLLESLQ